MPSVPSDPVNAPTQVIARGGPGAVAEPAELAVRGTICRPVTWWTVKPCLRQCAPPEFSATLPPIEQTTWLDGSGA